MEKNIAFEIIKRHGVLMALSLVMFLSVVDIFFVFVSESKMDRVDFVKTEVVCKSFGDKKLSNIPKLSQIQESSITKEAATSACSMKNISICNDLGSRAWAGILISFVVLLAFNLAWGILKNSQIQWVFEAFLAGIFIGFWFIFDQCAQNLWYPLYVAKLSIAIYVAYLYFFFKKAAINNTY